jgi:hypothetical protein
VQEEVSRLPERYRLPVVLCDLEGHTHAEAAAVLAWPVGSVSGRLSRARALLRDRLTQRGLAPAVGAALIVPAAGVPAGVVRAAVAAVSGTATIPVSVSSLTEGVLSAMRIAKLKLAAALVLGVVFLGVGGGAVIGLAQLPEPRSKAEPTGKVEGPKAPPSGPVAPGARPKWATEIPTGAFPELVARAPGADLAKLCQKTFGITEIAPGPAEDTSRRLLTTSLSQFVRYIQLVSPGFRNGTLGSDHFLNYLHVLEEIRGLVAELWPNEPKTIIAWLEEVVILHKDAEQLIRIKIEAGEESQVNLSIAIAHRLRAEDALWKAKNPKPAGR